MKDIIKRIIIISMVLLISVVLHNPVAKASYSVGFTTNTIKVLSPATSGQEYNDMVNISGTSSLNEVWFALRGPDGELIVYPAGVVNGQFSLDIHLRFGEGKYTIWAGNDRSYFDGTIRFEVISQSSSNRYASPSAYVDSDNADIIKLTNSLVEPEISDMNKLKAINNWVTANISYDYNAYLNGENKIVKASETIKTGKGICRDYSFVVAALSRVAGMETRIVYGETVTQDGWDPQPHAWNEVKVDDRWVVVDATWNAGYISENNFVASQTTKYFDPDPNVFAQTHRASQVTYY